MSIEGVLKSKKHGGAHGTTHENVDNNDLTLSDQFIVIQGLIKDDNIGDDGIKNQDGDRREHESDESGSIHENLPFLSDLRDGLDSYDQAIVENNTEWLKSRCKGLQQVEFDLPPHASVDDNIEFSGISIEKKELLIDTITSLAQSPLSACQTLVLNNDLDANRDDKKLVTSHIQSDLTNKESSISVITMDNNQLLTLETDNPVYSKMGDNPLEQIIFNPENKECKADDIEPLQEENMNSDKDGIFTDENGIFENGLVDAFNYHVENGIKGNVKMIVNDGVLTLVPNDDNMYSAITEEQQTATAEMNLINQQGAIVGSVPTSVLLEHLQAQSGGVQISSPQGNTNLNPQTVSEVNQTDNLALATISISTDKDTNSTKILVDTSQGRQLYQLNMSDLTALQSGGAIVNGQHNNPGAPNIKLEHAQGSKPVPGYILLPVQNPDGSSGMFAQPNSQGRAVTTTLPVGKDRGKQEAMYMCTHVGCGKLFKTLAKLTVHNMSHSGERPYKCSEPGCDWAFTKAYKLKRHEESHMGKKDHTCMHCNKKFTTIYNLNSHLKQHSRPCTEACPVEGCDRKFQTRRELDKHMKTHEGIEKTYKCPYEGCNKLFLSPHCLGSHPRVHQSEPVDLTCQFEGCGRKFDKLCRLKQHQRSHTGERPYVCHFEGCTWAFSTASKLTRHMTKHTNKRKWRCVECGKAFMRAEHLKGHMITHTGIKPFTCPVPGCGQKFVAKSSVYVHLKKHDSTDKDITYHCPMEACDRKYSNKAKLRQHIVKHFPGTLTPADAAQLDIVPLFKSGGKDIDKKSIQPTAVTVTTSEDGTMTIDPIEFIANGLDKDGEGEIQFSSMTNQFTAELTAELTSMVATGTAAAGEIKSPTTTQPKISVKKEPSESSGSARTDYHSNLLLSDRAKKRRRLLREKAEGSSLSEVDAEEHHTDGLPPTSSGTFPAGDSLTSHGITFRDPETGVLYVQTQLLQDDPPHPDLYSEDNVLNGELSPLVDSSDSEMNDHSSGAEFVGSTINLQDLVG